MLSCTVWNVDFCVFQGKKAEETTENSEVKTSETLDFYVY